MRKLLALLIVLLCASSQAQYLVGTLTVTNTPADGNTIVINGITRTAKSAVTTPSTQFLIGANTNVTTTNLYQQIAANPILGVLENYASSNVLTLRGPTLNVTFSGTWASIVIVTNVTTNTYVVRVPIEAESLANRTNISSKLVSALDTYPSNTFGVNSPALSNYVGIATPTTQVITATKVFLAIGTSNQLATNLTALLLTNNTLQIGAYNFNLKDTNGARRFSVVKDGTYIGDSNNVLRIIVDSPGTAGGGRISFADTNGNNTFFFTGDGIGFSLKPFTLGSLTNNDLFFQSTYVPWTLHDDAGAAKILVGQSGSPEFNVYGAAVVTNTTTGEAVLQTNGNVIATGGYFDARLKGTNTVNGSLAFTRRDISSLANGANSVDPSTNLFLKVSGPSGAFSINGLAGGRDGRILLIQNSTAQTLTVANDSGTEGTPANRIYTGTGADVVSANNPGAFTFIYDATASRWILLNHN